MKEFVKESRPASDSVIVEVANPWNMRKLLRQMGCFRMFPDLSATVPGHSD
jgi:hypothetical protein